MGLVFEEALAVPPLSDTLRARLREEYKKRPRASRWRYIKLWWRLTKESDGVAKLILARRPEERLINDYELIQATVRKVATTVAYLSLTWSTVVLLGGFVSVLKLIDFWFLTAISTAFAINVADLYEQKVAYISAAGRAYIGLCDDLAQRFSFWILIAVCSMLSEACLGVLMIAFSFVIGVLTFAPLVAIVLSLVRLMVNDYGNVGGDAANAAKLKAALQIFYSLALVQNTLFCFWKGLIYTCPDRASHVRKQCGFGNWGKSLVWRYVQETRKMCSTQGKVSHGWNLITFAVGLLGSESLCECDRRNAVRLLDIFVGNKTPVAPKLLPSKVPLENLMETLEVGDGETRERAARVVAALAGDLRHVDQFPSALHHIASLLQQASDEQFPKSAGAGTTMKSMQEQEDEQAGRNVYSGLLYRGILYLFNIYIYRTFKNKGEPGIPGIYGEPKQLISQGLLIIERLTQHQGNCVHICNNHVLLSKITSPLNSSNAFLDDAVEEYDSEWIDILSRTLRILARLIRAPGEANRSLRNETASNTQAVANLTRILEGDKFGPVLKAPAIQILAELASSDNRTLTSLGKGDKHKFITRLWGIFFAAPQKDGICTGDNNNRTAIEEEEEEETQQEQATRLRNEAGEALVQMLSVLDEGSSSDILQMLIPSGSEGHVVGQLTCMLITGNSKGCQTQTWATEILKCLCSHLINKHRQLPRQDVIQMLTKVLQLILSIQREESNGATAGVAGADSNHAAQNDEENPRPAVDHGGNPSSSSSKDEKEFVVALLSLAVAICDGTMVNAHDFIGAAPVNIVLLVTKLKEIIEKNNDATVECLQVVKLSCQLVVSMVQLEPSLSVKIFIDHSFMDVLSKSSKSLSDLDKCLMLFDANYHQVTKTGKPLASLVKQAQDLFQKAQELGGNNGPAA